MRLLLLWLILARIIVIPIFYMLVYDIVDLLFMLRVVGVILGESAGFMLRLGLSRRDLFE